MNVTIEKVDIDQKPILKQLMELYLYDFSEFDNDDVDEHGFYGYKYLDYYWVEPDRHPFFIKVNEKYAGFALVRKIQDSDQNQYSMAEFFIMKKYRKTGIGTKAAMMVFNEFPGDWEIAVLEENIPAQFFWKNVISSYTNNAYKEISKKDWKGPVLTFSRKN